MAISTRELDAAAFTARMTAEHFRRHYFQELMVERCRVRIYLQNVEFQVQQEFSSYRYRIDWRVQGLSGRFYITDSVFYDHWDRSSEAYIRHLVQDDVRRYCIEHRIECIGGEERDRFWDDYNHPFMYPPPVTEAAEQRAVQLLMRHLTPRQQNSYKLSRSFDVDVAKHFGRHHGTYLLISERAYNILHRNSNTMFCAVPQGSKFLPLADILLSQKLMLESNPDVLLSKANRKPIGSSTGYPAEFLQRMFYHGPHYR